MTNENINGDQVTIEDRLLSLPQVAHVLGVCVRTVRRLSMAGELPPLRKVGSATRMFKGEVDAYLNGLRSPKASR